MAVVADSEKVLVMLNQTVGKGPDLAVVRKDEENGSPDREQSANRRVRQRAEAGRSAYHDTDFHELPKDRSAADRSDELYRTAQRGRFEKPIIVASPDVLGVLRDAFQKEVAARVVAVTPKCLTNQPWVEIERILKEDLDGRKVA